MRRDEGGNKRERKKYRKWRNEGKCRRLRTEVKKKVKKNDRKGRNERKGRRMRIEMEEKVKKEDLRRKETIDVEMKKRRKYKMR